VTRTYTHIHIIYIYLYKCTGVVEDSRAQGTNVYAQDDDKEHAAFNKMTQVSVAEIEQLSLEEKRIKDDQAKLKRKIMLDRGMNMETGFDDITQY
jgi:hypothetical protein